MNKSSVNEAINHINDLCNSKAQACSSGQELGYHAEICFRMADHYEEESKNCGRGVPKALREQLSEKITVLRTRAKEFASPDAQSSRDNYSKKLKAIAANKH